MSTIEQATRRLRDIGSPDTTICMVVFIPEEVKRMAEDMGYALTDEEAANVLEDMERHQDNDIGVTYTSMRCNIEDAVAQRPKAAAK